MTDFPTDDDSFRHGFVNVCVNDLGLDEATVSQLTGHERGKSIMMNVYRKDKLPSQLIEAIGRIKFDLPPINPFDQEAGLEALKHALERKSAASR